MNQQKELKQFVNIALTKGRNTQITLSIGKFNTTAQCMVSAGTLARVMALAEQAEPAEVK